MRKARRNLDGFSQPKHDPMVQQHSATRRAGYVGLEMKCCIAVKRRKLAAAIGMLMDTNAISAKAFPEL